MACSGLSPADGFCLHAGVAVCRGWAGPCVVRSCLPEPCSLCMPPAHSRHPCWWRTLASVAFLPETVLPSVLPVQSRFPESPLGHFQCLSISPVTPICRPHHVSCSPVLVPHTLPQGSPHSGCLQPWFQPLPGTPILCALPLSVLTRVLLQGPSCGQGLCLAWAVELLLAPFP